MTTSIPAEEVNSAARRDCVQSPMGSWCFVKGPGEGTTGAPRKDLCPGISC